MGVFDDLPSSGVEKSSDNQSVFGDMPSSQTPQQETPEPQEKQGFLGGVASKTWGNIQESLSLPVPPPAKGFMVAGDVAGGVLDVAGGVISKITPENVKQEISKDVQAVLGTSLGKLGLNLYQQGSNQWAMFKEKYPTTSRVVEKSVSSGVNIASLLPFGKPAQITGEGVGKLAGVAATSLEKQGVKQATKDALALIKRDVSTLGKAERETALTSNWIEKPGVFKKPEFKTTPRDIEIAKSIEGVVEGKNPVKNIDRIYTKIGELAKKTETIPGKSDLRYYPEQPQLRNALMGAKEESSVVFAGDATLEKAYDSVVDEFMKIISKNTPPDAVGKLSDILKARKEFDKVMKSKFPNAFNKISGDNVRANAILDVRRAANDFIAGQLPEGNKFKALLKEQANLFQATRMIAKNTPAINPGVARRLMGFFGKHPWVSAEVLGVAGGVGAMSAGVGGAIVSTLTSPILLTGLALYGTVRVGKTIITSKMARTGMIKFLRATEKTLAPTEKAEILNVLAMLPQTTKRK